MVPWLKPTRASAEGGRLWRASSASRKRSQHRRRLVDADPALVRIAERQRKPLPADRRLRAGLRRVRRHEGGVRQQALPGAADLDQVVAVGAVAVQEHHELRAPGPSAARGADRRAQRPSRTPLALVRLQAWRGGDRHGIAPLDHAIIVPQQMRRHPAPRPPALGDLRELLRARSRLRASNAMRAASCSARSPAGQASAWPRQNSR